MKYKPFPTVCLKSEFEVTSAIADILSNLPNITIKHISSKSNKEENIDKTIYIP
jgi:hypothetical protein